MSKNEFFDRKKIEERIQGKLYKRKEKDDGDSILEKHVNNKLLRLFKDPENEAPGEVLFVALRFCCAFDIPLPDWIREEFLICHEAYSALDGDADSKTPLVSSFRTDPKIGNYRGQKRRKNQMRYLVWQKVNELHKDGYPIDVNTFSMVGEMFGLSGGSVSDLYYEIKKII